MAQFDIAPPVAFFGFDFKKENKNAAEQLLIKAGRPLKYFFLHSSAAELVFRALAWNHGYKDYAEKTVEYLISFFISRPYQGDPELTSGLSSVIGNRVHIHEIFSNCRDVATMFNNKKSV